MEQRNLTLADTALLMGFKPGHLGSKEGESFNTLEQYNIEKMQFPIIPIARKIEQEYNYKLFTPSERIGDERLFVKFDFKGLLQASAKDRMTFYDSMVSKGIMTPNDVLRLEDMNTFPEGDVRVMQMGFTTLQNVLEGKPASLFPPDSEGGKSMKYDMDERWKRIKSELLRTQQEIENGKP